MCRTNTCLYKPGFLTYLYSFIKFACSYVSTNDYYPYKTSIENWPP